MNCVPVLDGEAVKVADGSLGSILVDHGDEGVAFSGVVDVGDFATPAELVLEDLTGAGLVDPADEKSAARHDDLAEHDAVVDGELEAELVDADLLFGCGGRLIFHKMNYLFTRNAMARRRNAIFLTWRL